MGAAAPGGKGFKGRAAVSGDRPIRGARCRQQHHKVSCQTAPPPPRLRAATALDTTPERVRALLDEATYHNALWHEAVQLAKGGVVLDALSAFWRAIVTYRNPDDEQEPGDAEGQAQGPRASAGESQAGGLAASERSVRSGVLDVSKKCRENVNLEDMLLFAEHHAPGSVRQVQGTATGQLQQ